MSHRCTTDAYDALYARWLKNPGTLLDVVGYEPGQRVLDLCGGTGAISLECLRRGADPSTLLLADLKPRCPDARVPSRQGDFQYPTLLFEGRQGIKDPLTPTDQFDIIVIRQAAAYLWWFKHQIDWLYILFGPWWEAGVQHVPSSSEGLEGLPLWGKMVP